MPEPLESFCLDLLPGDDITRIRFVVGEPSGEFLPLGLRQGCRGLFDNDAVQDLLSQRDPLASAQAIDSKVSKSRRH